MILAEAANAVTDLGKLIVTLEPVPEGNNELDWKERYVARLSTGEQEVRGMHLFPGSPFHETIEPSAVGGDGFTYMDRWRWNVSIYRSARENDTERDAALERACKVMDRIRRVADLSTYGLELWGTPDVTFEAHGYGEISSVGVWVSELKTVWTFGVDEELLDL